LLYTPPLSSGRCWFEPVFFPPSIRLLALRFFYSDRFFLLFCVPPVCFSYTLLAAIFRFFSPGKEDSLLVRPSPFCALSNSVLCVAASSLSIVVRPAFSGFINRVFWRPVFLSCLGCGRSELFQVPTHYKGRIPCTRLRFFSCTPEEFATFFRSGPALFWFLTLSTPSAPVLPIPCCVFLASVFLSSLSLFVVFLDLDTTVLTSVVPPSLRVDLSHFFPCDLVNSTTDVVLVNGRQNCPHTSAHQYTASQARGRAVSRSLFLRYSVSPPVAPS